MSNLDNSITKAVSKTAVKTTKRRRSKRLSLIDALETVKRNKSTPSPQKKLNKVKENEIISTPKNIKSPVKTHESKNGLNNSINPHSIDEILALPGSSVTPCFQEGINEYKKLKKEQDEWDSLMKTFLNKRNETKLQLESVKNESNINSSFYVPQYIKDINDKIGEQENKLLAVLNNRKSLYTSLNNLNENFSATIQAKVTTQIRKIREDRTDPKVIINQLLDL